jgi:RNA polymerase-binding transcription factor DksA
MALAACLVPEQTTDGTLMPWRRFSVWWCRSIESARVMRLLDRPVADQSTESERDRSGDLTKVPFHFADLGSDVIEAEIAASNTTRLSNELVAIDDALERFYRAPEHSGICQDTGAPIPFARLDVIPWARTCDEAGA